MAQHAPVVKDDVVVDADQTDVEPDVQVVAEVVAVDAMGVVPPVNLAVKDVLVHAHRALGALGAHLVLVDVKDVVQHV